MSDTSQYDLLHRFVEHFHYMDIGLIDVSEIVVDCVQILQEREWTPSRPLRRPILPRPPCCALRFILVPTDTTRTTRATRATHITHIIHITRRFRGGQLP